MNVTTLAIAALVVMVAIGAAGVKGYSLGSDHERAATLAQALQDANANAAFTKKLQEQYRAKEQEWSVALSAVSKDYQGRLGRVETAKNIALDSLRRGALVLRDPGAKPETCGSGSTQVATPAAGRDGKETGGLSAEASGFLLSEAARADAYTEQLGACQAALDADRR